MSVLSESTPVAGAAALGSTLHEQTVAGYFDAFGPAPAWDELVRWPPDVFALANLVLDHTEGYRFVVAPPDGRSWPPLSDWGAAVCGAAREWRESPDRPDVSLPPLVESCWDTVTRRRDTPLSSVRRGEPW